MDTQQNLALGKGIYTVPDIAQILRLPYGKVHRWITAFWEKEFAKKNNAVYSWTDGKARAVGFHTLVEIYTFYQLTKAGVSVDKITSAHEILGEMHKTPFPFATDAVLNSISTDGKKVFYTSEGIDILIVDNTVQFNLDFIKGFFKKIDFDGGTLAKRLWPLGRDKAVVVDPSHQFGQAVIQGTNIIADTLAELYIAGESKEFIASLYGVTEKQIEDALDFCQAA